MGIALLIAGFALSATSRVRAYSHPRSVIEPFREALATGNVAKLRTDQHLAMRGWTDSLVRELGEAEHQRLLGIFDRARNAGQQAFSQIVTAATNGARNALSALPEEQQRLIARQSHDAWVWQHGFESLPEPRPTRTWQELVAEPATAALVRSLGADALDPDERGRLGDREANDPAVGSDPMLASLAEQRTRAGLAALARIREQAARAGERALRHLPWSEQQRIENESRDRFLIEHGFQSLPAEDRARLGSANALNDTTGEVAERLGRAALTPAERAEISQWTRERLAEAHSRVVQEAGARKAGELLLREYGGATLDVTELVVQGADARDLVRRQTARAALVWNSVGTALRQMPSGLALSWNANDAEWRITQVFWRDREAPANDAAPALIPVPTPAVPSDTRNESVGAGSAESDGTNERGSR